MDPHAPRRSHSGGVPASFALNLIACRAEIDWSACKGFVDDPQRLTFP